MATTRCRDSNLCVPGRWRDSASDVSLHRFDLRRSKGSGAIVRGVLTSLLFAFAVALVFLLAVF